MPTPKQIYEMREAQEILGLSDDEFYCRDFSREPITGRNYNREKTIEESAGEEFGTIIYRPKTGESRLFFHKSRGKK